MAFMHGAQDGQKFIAVFLLSSSFALNQSHLSVFEIPLWMMILWFTEEILLLIL